MSPGPDIVRGRLPLSTAAELPAELADLADLVLDLHWTWSHGADALWRQIDAETWDRTRNPWIILQEASTIRLKELAADQGFVAELRRLASQRRAELGTPGWFSTSADSSSSRCSTASRPPALGCALALPSTSSNSPTLPGQL